MNERDLRLEGVLRYYRARALGERQAVAESPRQRQIAEAVAQTWDRAAELLAEAMYSP